jgi:hypothetical protein
MATELLLLIDDDPMRLASVHFESHGMVKGDMGYEGFFCDFLKG